MNPVPTAARLAELALAPALDAAGRAARLERIRAHVLSKSLYLGQPDIIRIHPLDLELLFDAYDAGFFEGQCRAALAPRRLEFRLSPRLTRSAGVTRRIRHRDGEFFEIAVATAMLFDAFRPGDRGITVCGLVCDTRLDALERIFEHEMVHLIEHLCWNRSNCRGARFRSIAAARFGHLASTHQLITRRERAAGRGIHPGTRVAFHFEGRRIAGEVARITRRATVLVEDPAGELFSDGRRYLRYYVPVTELELLG